MKINITVDLSEFYSEDDSSTLSEQIKNAIAYEVKTQVLAVIKKDLGVEFTKNAIENIRQQVSMFIDDAVKQLATDMKIHKYASSTEMVSIEDYIKEELQRIYLSESRVTQQLTSMVNKTADTLSKELKDRYDLLFASKIVKKLHENKMLKEDVAQILLKEQ